MVKVPAWVRLPVALVASVMAVVAAVASFPHMHELASRAGDGELPWLGMLATDGLLLGSALVLLAGQTRSWSAWVTIAASIPLNWAIATTTDTDSSWVIWVVAIWPTVVLALGCVTFIRNAQRIADHQEAGQ